ncbi:SpoIIE family protein phosphatase [Kineococcus sp. SYSU DK006]|uniref:PP2C family protein-serine/threonine phosphatase n=1 Tax=Kineococcus sp. SYSU DK006 TaxID=3383127 RepID=UPI003D7D53D9
MPVPTGVWARAWDSSADGMLVLEPDWSVRYVNRAGARALGLQTPADGHRDLWSLLPQLRGTPFEHSLRRLERTGEPVTWEMEHAPHGWFEQRAYRVDDRTVVVLHDADARRAAQLERGQLLGRMSVLLSLASALARTDTVEDVARAALAVVRDHLGADYAGLSMIDGPWVTTLGLGQVDPAVEQVWHRLPLDHPDPATQVARTGRPLVFTTFAELAAAFPASRERLERAGLRSGTVLPLTIADGWRIGAFSVAWRTDHRLTDSETELLTAVADATAQAARRAQLYAERRDVAHTLQAAMLPELPRLPGLELAGRYVPWSPTDEQVGGDWYDALALPGGGSLFVIGDVAGHDVQAAAQMGQVRAMLRALSVDRPQESPAALVARLDHVLAELGADTLTTLTVVRLDPPGAPRQLRWSTAGHPPGVLVDAGGCSTVVDGPPDLPLGVDASAPRHEHVTPWPPGGTLVLYTDGLVERRDQDVWEGVGLLRRALERTHTAPLDELLDALVADTVARAEDDCAVLAVREPRP